LSAYKRGFSAAHYKQNVSTIENPLGAILNLRGVTFDGKRDEFKDMHFTQVDIIVVAACLLPKNPSCRV
jgi:hypothetical protein